MPLHRGAQIPIKGTLVVAVNAQPHRIHDTDQFFRIRIAGPGSRHEFAHRLGKLALLHQLAGTLDIGRCRFSKTEAQREDANPDCR